MTPGGDEEGAEVAVVVDPDATSHAEVTLSALDKEGDLPEPVRAPAERLRGSLGRQAALEGCRSAAEQLGEDLGDTERWAAQGEGKAQGEFFRLLDGYLGGSLGQLSPAQRDQLRAAAAPILRLQKEATAGVLAEADKTRAAGAEAAAIVETAAREAHMMATARDLRDDRAVDPADLAAAIDTFQALGSAELQ